MHAIDAPSDTPKMTADLRPSASMTARMIVGSLFERCHLRRAIGQTCAALIKTDEPANRSQFQKKIRAHRKLPIHVQMGKGSRWPNEVEWAGAVHLIGNVNVAALSVV